MADYIPAGDSEFDVWENNFVAYATANAAALGLDPVVDIPPLAAAQGIWDTDHAANATAQAAAQSARQAKDGAREAFEGVIRPLVAVARIHSCRKKKLKNKIRPMAQRACMKKSPER